MIKYKKNIFIAHVLTSPCLTHRKLDYCQQQQQKPLSSRIKANENVFFFIFGNLESNMWLPFLLWFLQKNEEKNNNKNGKVNRNDCKYKIKVIDKQIKYNEKMSFIFATKINIFAFEMDVFIEFVFDYCMKK